MKKLILAAALSFATSASAFAQDINQQVSVVTSGDPQIQLMSMVLSVQAAQQGVDVHVLLCGAAGEMALKDASEAVQAKQPPLNVSPQDFMTLLSTNDNVTIEVCALYLPSIGQDKTALMDGVGVASPGKMAKLLTTGNARVITF